MCQKRRWGRISDCDGEELGTLDSGEKTSATLKGRCWPQVAKREEKNIIKTFLSNTRKRRNERQNVGGVST